MIIATMTGNIGRDAEVKTLPSGATVCEFTAASSKKNRNGQDDTQWVRVAIFGKRGEALSRYLTKGSKVCVVGELTVREYGKKDGSKGVSVEINASEIDLMGGGQRSESRAAPPPASNGYGAEYDTPPSGDDIPF